MEMGLKSLKGTCERGMDGSLNDGVCCILGLCEVPVFAGCLGAMTWWHAVNKFIRTSKISKFNMQ